MTGDRDAYQLVRDPLVKVLYNRRGVTDYVLYDEAGIEERTGVRPGLYPFLASLRGDPSDNLPGVPGVGEKTAAKLVNTYGDVDTLYAHLGEQTPKLRASLAEHEAQVRLNLQMTPLVRDVPLNCVTDDLVLGRSNREEMRSLFELLEIRGPATGSSSSSTAWSRWPGGRRVPARTASRARSPVRTALETVQRPVQVVVLEEVADARAWLASLASSPGPIAIEAVWAGAAGRSAVEGLALAALGEALVPAGDEDARRGSSRARRPAACRGLAGRSPDRRAGHRRGSPGRARRDARRCSAHRCSSCEGAHARSRAAGSSFHRARPRYRCRRLPPRCPGRPSLAVGAGQSRANARLRERPRTTRALPPSSSGSTSGTKACRWTSGRGRCHTSGRETGGRAGGHARPARTRDPPGPGGDRGDSPLRGCRASA